MPDAPFSGLYRRLGLYSRFAGLGFIALSVVFLILSVYDGFIVFELDSVFAFFAGMVLLFRDPSARVSASVFEAFQLSSDEAIRELAGSLGARFSYSPGGERVTDVMLIPTRTKGNHPDQIPNGSSSRAFVPPGRGLAELFRREKGLNRVTMDALRASLSQFVREELGMAGTTTLQEEGERVRVVLTRTSSTCACIQPESPEEGFVGCTVASFFAVLVSSATGKSVLLGACTRDARSRTWTVPMRLGKAALVAS